MPCIKYGNAILMMGGPTLRIESGGKVFFFEFHNFLGPSMFSSKGKALDKFPPKRSPFWDALYFWIKQGKRVENGKCIFEHEMELVQIVQKIGPRTYKVCAAPVLLSRPEDKSK